MKPKGRSETDHAPSAPRMTDGEIEKRLFARERYLNTADNIFHYT
ncbi:MAG: hypothetical protein ACR2P3_05465 [Geminicoccaceae bacterium]